jgi:hypothetical protein
MTIKRGEYRALTMEEIPQEIHNYYVPDVYCESAVQAKDGRIIIEFEYPSGDGRYMHVWQQWEGKWQKI